MSLAIMQRLAQDLPPPLGRTVVAESGKTEASVAFTTSGRSSGLLYLSLMILVHALSSTFKFFLQKILLPRVLTLLEVQVSWKLVHTIVNKLQRCVLITSAHVAHT